MSIPDRPIASTDIMSELDIAVPMGLRDDGVFQLAQLSPPREITQLDLENKSMGIKLWLDPTISGDIRDISGNNVPLEIRAGVSVANIGPTPEITKSLAFSGGNNAIITAPASYFLSFQRNFTVEFWYRLASYGPHVDTSIPPIETIFSKWSYVLDQGGFLEMARRTFWMGYTGDSIAWYPAPALNTWVHRKTVKVGNVFKMYLNNELVSEVTHPVWRDYPHIPYCLGAYAGADGLVPNQWGCLHGWVAGFKYSQW